MTLPGPSNKRNNINSDEHTGDLVPTEFISVQIGSSDSEDNSSKINGRSAETLQIKKRRKRRERCFKPGDEDFPRFMKERCKCGLRDKGQMKCGTITEDERQSLYNNFQKLTWDERKTYVNLQVKSIAPKRVRGRTNGKRGKRSRTLFYYLKINEENVRVCKTMFSNTLGVGFWSVLNWKQAMNHSSL